MQPTTPSRYAEIIADLARPADIRNLPMPSLHVIMGMRLCALFEQAGREPLVELTTRLASVTAAEALLALTRAVAANWPERFTTARPCCMAMTPDERTVSRMAGAALSGNRAAFSRELEGLVKANCHEPLYCQTVKTLAELSALENWKASRQPL